MNTKGKGFKAAPLLLHSGQDFSRKVDRDFFFLFLKNEQFKNSQVSHFSPLIYSVFPTTYIPYSDDEMINFQA